MKKYYVLIITILTLSSWESHAAIDKNAVRIIARFNTAPDIHSQSMESGYFTFGIKELDDINKSYGCHFVKSLNPRKTMYVLQFDTKSDVKAIVAKYISTGLFKYVEPDHIGHSHGMRSVTPNDPYFGNQWALLNDGSFPLGNVKKGADIHMEDAWQVQEGSSKVIVAIIDGGCKLNHPEFSGRWWINSQEISNNGKDDDGDGYIDNLNGWDWANDDNDPSDDNGHGTNVTSILAANGNNNNGFAGVDWHARLIACKVLDQNGDGFYSNWIDAIYYSVYHDARVINMSVGGTDTSKAMREAIEYAVDTMGVTIVASMGNTNNNEVNYPAAFKQVIAVGATNPDDTRCNPFSWGGGSNYGNYISVVAPGNYIFGLAYNSDTNYSVFWGGTSQAAPFVSGLASLLLAQNSNYTPADIRRVIQNTADDQVGNASEDVKGWDQYYGYGRINAGRALNLAAGIESDSRYAFPVQVWPNPSNGDLNLQYTLPSAQLTELDVYDIHGRLLEVHDLGRQNGGSYTEKVNYSLANGMYIVKLKGSKFDSRPMKFMVAN